jgi:CDP-glucose 4,6-dehydratase
MEYAQLKSAYGGKPVFVTGHTGFKGSWLTLWLTRLGARVTGYALPPDDKRGLFTAAGVEADCNHITGDIRDLAALRQALAAARPAVVFHLAAQPLVRRSYLEPLETLETNVMGTARLLEAIRAEKLRCAVVVVTSDKCYENREWAYGYREDEPMGGHDVYSMSKGAAELVVSSFRRSFFPPAKLDEHGVAIASARAGNVIGGGDWSADRIVPDAIGALLRGVPIPVRYPDAVRPWQHVLEPLGGYLTLGVRLCNAGADRPADFCEAWNFGPNLEAVRPVRELVAGLVETWGGGRWEARRDAGEPHEAKLLRLCIDKAHARLGWLPRWDFTRGIQRTVAWYRAQAQGASAAALRALCMDQIREYMPH